MTHRKTPCTVGRFYQLLAPTRTRASNGFLIRRRAFAFAAVRFYAVGYFLPIHTFYKHYRRSSRSDDRSYYSISIRTRYISRDTRASSRRFRFSQNLSYGTAKEATGARRSRVCRVASLLRRIPPSALNLRHISPHEIFFICLRERFFLAVINRVKIE